MADDDDTIFIEVKAKVDEASFDEAEGRLRDKFKDVGKNIGDSIKDATSSIGDHVKDVSRSIGDAFKDYLDQDVKDSIKDIGRGLRDEVKSGDVRGALDDIEKTVRGTTDLITGIGEAFGVHLDNVGSIGHTIGDTISELGDRVDAVTGKVHNFSTGLHAFKSGDISKGVNDLGSAFHGLLPDSLQDGLTNTLQVFNDTHDTIKDTLGVVDELKGALKLGGEAGLGTSLLGPEVAIPAALLAAGGYAAYHLPKQVITDDFLFRGADDFLNGGRGPNRGGEFPRPVISLPELGMPQAQPSMTPTSQLPSFAPLDTPDDVSDPLNMRSNLRGYPSLPANYVPTPVVRDGGGSGGSSNVQAQTATVEAGSATVMASSVSLGGISLSQVLGGVSLPGAASPSAAARDPRDKALSGLGMGQPTAPKYWPGFSSSSSIPSIAPQDHHSGGGMISGDSPGYDNHLGSVGGKPIGLEGGEFVINPDATQANLPLLRAINSGKLSHFDEGGGPVGAPAPDPNITTQPEPPTSQPIQQQQMGHGSGIGVTGGGALGMAEQAGVMAATMFGFGGGGMAAQIGMQEMNLAIQEGGKMGAAVAMALPETFGLAGGQMGAPSVGQGGWFKKIVGGMLGSMTNLPNVAGATQPPKQHGQKEGGPDAQVADDPLNGSKPAPQGKTGPTGHQDDPIHVKQVPPPGGAPQGQATSAMNTAGVMSAITA